MNAIWSSYPDYALEINKLEQLGQNDLVAETLKTLGIDVEPNISPDSLLVLYPDAGKDFLLLKARVKA